MIDEKDHPAFSVRQETALRELHVALRRAQEDLRHAHSVLAPFALSQRIGLRSGPRPSPPNGFKPFVPVAHEVVLVPLRDDVRAHLAEIRQLKEENRRLCDDVARLVGQRPARSWPQG